MFLLPFAWAFTVRIDATVSADLQVVRGTVTTDAPEILDPLALLAVPSDDRGRLRTFPGVVESGEVTWVPLPGFPDTWRFEARLPRRFGDVGRTSTSLMANGGWYPQAVESGVPVVADWDVIVRGPGVLVLNGRVGDGEVRWQGRTDRAALAVHLDGEVRSVAVPGGSVTVVDRGRERRSHLEIATLAPAGVTIVEAPDFLRLASPAPGMVYLSDRAFRLTPGFYRFHRAAVHEALLSAASPLPVAWERDFVAAAASAAIPVPDPGRALGWLAWNPVVDALLHDGTLPYYGDIFTESWRDEVGLLDSLARRPPARVAVAHVIALRGLESASALATLVQQGRGVREAAASVTLPVELVDGWFLPPVEQDYRVVVEDGLTMIRREAPREAPAEVVRVVVDGGEPAPWFVGPGPAVNLMMPTPRSVRVDPGGEVQETSRVNNHWPPRWGVTLSGGLYNFSPSQGSFEVFGDAALRREGDSRNLYLGTAWHDEQDIVGLSFGYVRYIGPSLNRLLRTHRLVFYGGPALLDPRFRPTSAGAVALGGSVSYAWDTRQGELSLRGHRLGVGIGGGLIPGSEEAWESVSASAMKLVPLHPRLVLAGRVKGGWASGDVEHRLLTLGGGDDVRSVTEVEVVGNSRVVGNLELRMAPLRYASIPVVGLAWVSEVQLTPGIEVGAVWRDGERWSAVGGTLGLHAVVDGFGARPTFVGGVVAMPLWQEGFSARGPQVFIDFEQAF